MSTETPKSEIQRLIEAHAERPGWTLEAKALLDAAALHQRIGELECDLSRVTEERDTALRRIKERGDEIERLRAEKCAAQGEAERERQARLKMHDEMERQACLATEARMDRDAALRRVEDAEKALDYYRSAFLKRRPNWLPSRVRVLKEVRADYPMGDAYVPVSTGETECRSNRLGAVSVVNASGIEIGLRPDEFEVIEWSPARLDAAEKGGGK